VPIVLANVVRFRVSSTVDNFAAGKFLIILFSAPTAPRRAREVSNDDGALLPSATIGALE